MLLAEISADEHQLLPSVLFYFTFGILHQIMSTTDSAVSWSDIRPTPSLRKEQILFTSGSTVTIRAPAEKVFDIITAFDKYEEWNTWCPRFMFKEGEEIGPGSIGVMHCRMEAQNKDYEIPEQVSSSSTF
jgi:hypothetical protein